MRVRYNYETTVRTRNIKVREYKFLSLQGRTTTEIEFV